MKGKAFHFCCGGIGDSRVHVRRRWRERTSLHGSKGAIKRNGGGVKAQKRQHIARTSRNTAPQSGSRRHDLLFCPPDPLVESTPVSPCHDNNMAAENCSEITTWQMMPLPAERTEGSREGEMENRKENRIIESDNSATNGTGDDPN